MSDQHVRIVKRTVLSLSFLALLWIVPAIYCFVANVKDHNTLKFMRVFHLLVFGGAIGLLLYSMRRLLACNLARETRARKEAEGLYRLLFNSLREACAYCRVIYENGKPVDFVYLDVNESFLRETGLTDVIGKKVTELFPFIMDFQPDVIGVAGRVAINGKPEIFESYLPNRGVWLSNFICSPQKEYIIGYLRISPRQACRTGAARKRTESAPNSTRSWRGGDLARSR